MAVKKAKVLMLRIAMVLLRTYVANGGVNMCHGTKENVMV